MDIFHMTDIIPLLGLPSPPHGRISYYIPCPCCDSGRDKHLNINLKKDVFRCPRCGFSGGIFDLYAHYTNTPHASVREAIRLKLGRDASLPAPDKRKSIEKSPEIVECPLTDIDARNETYQALLRKLSLANDHRDNLLSRGLSASVIADKGYKTTPVVGFTTLAKQLQADGLYLGGIPGFYRTQEGNWTFAYQKRGIIVPVRDLQGRIQGLQVRRDNVSRRKYRWISSSERQDGCRASGFVHVAGPIREEIILIEGPLKADVVNSLTGQTLVAVPGVNALTELETVLHELHTLGVKKLMTAFDMDFLKNRYVQDGYYELLRLIDSVGLRFGTYLWNPAFNGLDDYVWEYCFEKQLPIQPF